MAPVPLPGQFEALWTASKPGAYLTEITAQRAGKELGRDVLTFQRMDGVAENFHTEQNHELLERLATQTGGQYWKPADLDKLAAAIPFSEAGVTMRDTRILYQDLPLVFVILLLLRFFEWWLRRSGASSSGRPLRFPVTASFVTAVLTGRRDCEGGAMRCIFSTLFEPLRGLH